MIQVAKLYTNPVEYRDDVCIKIPYKGYEISITMQKRPEIVVFCNPTTTGWTPPIFETNEVTAEGLQQAFTFIDSL